jgi:hypothetical protein
VTAVSELVIAADVSRWERIGITIVDDLTQIGTVRLRFVSPADRTGIVAWGLAGLPDSVGAIDAVGGAIDDGGEVDGGGVDARGEVDGVPTFVAAAPFGPAPAHRLGAVGFDHLVVMTSSLERTCAAIELATGEPLKRVREAGPIRQGFHRLGEVIVEVVESAATMSDHAVLWGLAWNVEDIHEACAELGPEVVSLPKPAVQPGRLISSFREQAGLGLAVAMMSPGR